MHQTGRLPCTPTFLQHSQPLTTFSFSTSIRKKKEFRKTFPPLKFTNPSFSNYPPLLNSGKRGRDGKVLVFHHGSQFSDIHDKPDILMIFFPLPLKNISEIIHSETVRNSFILEPLRAFKFQICFNHGESIHSETIRNSFILEHFRAFKFKIFFDHC